MRNVNLRRVLGYFHFSSVRYLVWPKVNINSLGGSCTKKFSNLVSQPFMSPLSTTRRNGISYACIVLLLSLSLSLSLSFPQVTHPVEQFT
ncbi:hypothetical protein BDV25DRAFT_69772 [Aspergillus avenaceus]|uniref:Uncharacterized protein n=1 Tax=Aspergillus avenaceus TaxID=36643 RepID=A0A5N6TGX4_ASPAV|nr:hypothetical protein BDV25DRAFT_69772 [Aspergillus avenaceus]